MAHNLGSGAAALRSRDTIYVAYNKTILIIIISIDAPVRPLSGKRSVFNNRGMRALNLRHPGTFV